MEIAKAFPWINRTGPRATQQGIMFSVERQYLYPQGSRSYRRGPSPREKASVKKKKKKQWYHCREWQNSKCTQILCGYIGLKNYIMFTSFFFFPLMHYTALLMSIKCGLCLQGNLLMRDLFSIKAWILSTGICNGDFMQIYNFFFFFLQIYKLISLFVCLLVKF